MNVSQALEQANALFFPEILYCSGYQAMETERLKNEEAIEVLREAYFAEDDPSFSFDIVRELADRNRELCDEIGLERIGEAQGRNLARALSDNDLHRAVATLQGRTLREVLSETHGDKGALGAAYVSAPIAGTVLGLDIETTSRDPERGYIINIGWMFMELADGAEPYGAASYYCGIAPCYKEKGIPLASVHHISWDDVASEIPFRENKELQSELLGLLTTYPYMAHNASFEDSWLILQLDGYAEARKAGDIIPIDTRDICRRLDSYVASALPSSNPASLENWAHRRGTLAADESERHLGLDDTALMLRTVREEFALKNMFAGSQEQRD